MPGDKHYYQAKFDEPLNLPLRSKPVEECEIMISLNYYLLFRTSFIIGQIRLSAEEPDYEAIHFQNMIDSPGDRISTWYEMQSFFTSYEGEQTRWYSSDRLDLYLEFICINFLYHST